MLGRAQGMLEQAHWSEEVSSSKSGLLERVVVLLEQAELVSQALDSVSSFEVPRPG